MRTCLFCGRTPTTKEHVLPEWLAQTLGVTRLVVDSSVSSDTWTSVDSFGLTSNMFCGPHCNHGWMSDLEDAVKPFLGPLAKGRRQALTRDEQAILAQWFWKTALVADTSGRNPVFDSFDYARFYRDRRPPDRTVMWIGGFRTKTTAARLLIYQTVLHALSIRVGAHRVISLSIGGVVLQVRSLRAGRMFRFREGARARDWDQVAARFLPAIEVSITPPHEAMEPDDFKQFAERWRV